LKALLKKTVFGQGRRAMNIPFGLYAGLKLSIDPSCETGFLLGTYEAETTAWLRQAGRRARSVLDIGAGYGELTAWALRQPEVARVLAYDPKPERWPVFQENLSLNGLSADRRLQAVAGWFLGPEDESRTLQVLAELPEPILLKLDVDGGEEAILRRLHPLLSTKSFLVLVETHSPELDRACLDLLEDSGYSARVLPPAWWRAVLPERRPLAFNRWIAAERTPPRG
jgi:SAM-dependent methyltransferase